MNREPERDALRPEYDFTAGAKGRHRRAYRQGTNAVLLEPDVAAVFKDASAVNTALRALVQVAAAQAVANVDLFQRTDRRTDEPEPTAHLYCRTPSKGDCRLPPDEGGLGSSRRGVEPYRWPMEDPQCTQLQGCALVGNAGVSPAFPTRDSLDGAARQQQISLSRTDGANITSTSTKFLPVLGHQQVDRRALLLALPGVR